MSEPAPTTNIPPHLQILDDINALLRPATTHEARLTYTARVPVPTPDLWETITIDPATSPGFLDHLTKAGITWTPTKTIHSVTHPALLDQLHTAITASPLGNDDAFASIPQSKPAARLDAIAALQRIDRESTFWATTLNSRTRVPLRDRLRGLVGAAASADPDTLTGDTIRKGGLTRAVRGWTITARVVTGWERPTWSPNVPCPNLDCEQRGTIRIRLEQGIGLCTKCGTFWDRSNIGVLGDYVRWAAEHLAGPRHWQYDVDGYPRECSECLLTRELMAERQAARISAAKADTPTAVGA